MIDKVQAYLTPKDMREVQESVGILGIWRTFISLKDPAQGLHLLYHWQRKGTRNTGNQFSKLPLRKQKY